MKFLPELFASIMAQTYQDISVLVIDNASSDKVESFVREQYPQFGYLRNARNLGFAPAHNQGIRYVIDHLTPQEQKEAFILVTNPDIILTPTYIETLMKAAHDHPDAGSFGGKLLRAFGDGVADEVLKETVTSDQIDTTGLRINKSFTVAERGAGELDTGQYDADQDVFGISGALALYRVQALTSVRFKDEFFDHDFFAYKEDVDLAWRLRRAGWGARYVPEAVAYHHRAMYRKERLGLIEKIRNRKHQPAMRTFYSTRNHVWMVYKNIYLSQALIYFPRLLAQEMSRFMYVCFAEPSHLKAYGKMLLGLPKMYAKRRASKEQQTARASEINRFL